MASELTVPWTVTSQREDFQPGPNGQLVQGVVVSFTTAAGVQGSVFVPNAEYVPDRVRAYIAARAAAMDAVSRLTGG